MVKLFGDSDDGFSDSDSVSNRPLSMTNVLNIEENDDRKEKRAKSILNDNGLINLLLNNNYDQPDNNNSKSNSQFTLPSCYTQEQIGSHIENCLKLAVEDKITSKNAFNLHLIDDLGEYTKELKNFHTVGLLLDACSKIYAGRVDSILTNTYQVLTRLNNVTEDKQSNEQEPWSDDLETTIQLSDDDQPDEE